MKRLGNPLHSARLFINKHFVQGNYKEGIALAQEINNKGSYSSSEIKILRNFLNEDVAKKAKNVYEQSAYNRFSSATNSVIITGAAYLAVSTANVPSFLVGLSGCCWGAAQLGKNYVALSMKKKRLNESVKNLELLIASLTKKKN